ncbi:hypothetical protein [Burkholderia glumae]|uniref:hypothetical protein n=1 Tax=Burkholderia glumae TaxID=337 RepID=UPI0020367FAC|nr:hypothetical protein [Burkholderia glumae]MCM2551675.1 hypothetical protein [Burkholderia glumae]
MKRRQLNKAQLLPLAPDYQRRVQLRHHLALAALREARATPEQLALLLSTVQIAYLLRAPAVRDQLQEGAHDGLDLYRRAEQALERCYARLGGGAPIALRDDERSDLERLVTAYDARLAGLPSHRYVDAQAELHHYVFTGRSPIPPAAAPEVAQP